MGNTGFIISFHNISWVNILLGLTQTYITVVGATRSHVEYFKKHRAARIDHYVIELNKLIIRLEKVCFE